MWKTSLTVLALGSLTLAGPSRNPQHPFPAPPINPQTAGMWSTFWWADYDGDGALDVLVLHPSAPARLYRNAGEGRFEDVTQLAGLGGVLGARQALWADFDGDGRPDLFLTAPGGRSRLMRNAPGGIFEDVTAASALGVERGVLHAEVLDYDQDGAPDLLLVTPERERFLRNLGGAVFEEVALALPPRPSSGFLLPGQEGPELGALDPVGEGLPERSGAERPEGGAYPGGSQSASSPARSPSSSSSLFGGSGLEAGTLLICADTIEDFVNPGVCLSASSDPILGMLYPISSDWFVSPIGRVGLGTTSPTERLHVAGRIRAEAQIISDGQFISTAPTGAPLSVASSTKVTNLNADLLDGLDSSDFRKTADLIGNSDLASGAVTNVKLGDSAVATAKIANFAVTSGKLADSSVTTTKIANLAVTDAKLASDSVVTAKIADGAVTAAKLAAGAVSGTQLAANSVNTTHILDGTILNADVSPSAAILGTKIAPNFGSQDVVTTGRGGFGVTNPNSHLHVNAPAGDTPFRVQITGGSRFTVASNGGATIGGFNNTPPENGLYVVGDLGVGTSNPTAKVHAINSANVFEPIAGRFVSNGHNSAVGVDVEGRSVGIRARNTETSLSYAGDFESPASGGGAAVRGRNTASGGLAYGGRFEAASNTGAGGIGVLGFATASSGTNYGVYGQTNSSSGYAGYFFGGRNYFQGNVGIGTNNPGFQLQLSANSAAKPTSNTWTIFSDERLKEDIRTIDGALGDLLALRGVTYRWKDPASQGDMDGTYTGFIAQEVEKVFPEWIEEGSDGFKRLTVIGFEGLVVEALRELREEKDAELARLRDEQALELAAASERVAELEAQVAAQGAQLERIAASLALLLEDGGAPPAGR